MSPVINWEKKEGKLQTKAGLKTQSKINSSLNFAVSYFQALKGGIRIVHPFMIKSGIQIDFHKT